MDGTMLWFNDAKDAGVIATEAGDRFPVFGTEFAADERPKGRCAGTPVTFRIAEEGDERRAADVRLVPEVAPRRARMRHARYRSHN